MDTVTPGVEQEAERGYGELGGGIGWGRETGPKGHNTCVMGQRDPGCGEVGGLQVSQEELELCGDTPP